MDGYATKLQSLEDVIREHREIRKELEEFKQIAKAAGDSADRANKRVDALERRLDKIDGTLVTIMDSIKAQGESIGKFDKKQDVFLSNTWQLVKYLLILLGGIITILGGLVGVKLSFF
jgi:chromosome segregation ATPase